MSEMTRPDAAASASTTSTPRSNLTSAQRKALRGMAHGLKPLVQLGRSGLGEGLLQNLDHALEQHELVKVRFLDFKDQKKVLCDEISGQLDCDRVGLIGHVAIFFRPARDPEKRRIDVNKL